VAVAVVDVQVKDQNAVSSLRRIDAASKSAESGIQGLKGAVTGLVGAIGAVSAAKFVFAKTAELETQTKSLQVLTGSVQQAKQIIQELQQIGAVTPFTSTELIDAAKRLQAFGVKGERVVDVTQRLADASGATGAELQGIVTAYGQVIAKGRLQGEELLQFQERGIGLQQELQKMYKLSGQELQDALGKGRISAQAVEAAFVRLTSTGGKYANGAIAQSDTLSGKLSTLQDGVDQLARRIGEVLTPVLKSVFTQAIAVVDAVNQALAAGRGGGFSRSVFGARQLINVGATSQAVDNIAKGIGQISAQKNKAGIDQNLQALQKYQRLLQSIGADDPNASKAVELQGLILEKINQNLDAQNQLNKETKAQADIFKIPELTASTAGKGGKGGKADRQSQLADILAANGLYRSQQSLLEQISQAEMSRDTRQVLYLQHVQRSVELLNQAAAIQRDQALPADEKQAKLRGIQDQLAASTAQYNREIAEFQRQAAEGLPTYINDLSSMAAGYSNVLDYSKRLTDEQIKQQELAQGIANVVGQNMTSAFDALIQGTESFGNSLRKIASGVLIDIARQLLQIYVINQAINAISSLFGPSTGGFLPGVKFNTSAFSMPQLAGGLASGGPAMAGKSYLVGEQGPEIFTPNKSGTVIPNGALGGMGGGITVNVDASGSSVEGDAKQQKALGAAIGAAVQAELIKQKKPGGLLY